MIADLVAMTVIPPAMTRRAISPDAAAYAGSKIAMQVGGNKFTLYIPASWKPARDLRMAVHFHGPDWHSIQEHIAAGQTTLLISTSPGEGSTVYGKLMGTKGTLDSWISATLTEIRKRGAPQNARITELDLSSFSAGYGAIRELVQQPEVYRRVRSVILCDSMYGSLAPGAERKPLDAHVKVWEPLARDAMAGRKTFVATVSSVATPTYASSAECLSALVDRVHREWRNADPKWPASADADYPLFRTAGAGKFFAWHYGGNDAGAHTTHIRHLADIRVALEKGH